MPGILFAAGRTSTHSWRRAAQSHNQRSPSALSRVIAASAGKEHGLALKSDGTVLAWGTGLTNYPNDFADEGQSMVPPGLSNVMFV